MLFPEPSIDTDNIVVDEWMQQAIKEDSLAESATNTIQTKTAAEIIAGVPNEKESTDTIFAEDKVVEKKEIVEGTKQLKEFPDEINESIYLNHFYHSLEQLEKSPNTKKVRIAYFGDSMTDGDMIVQDLRKLFQEKYGGAGVGFVPITSESATSRGSIHHRFSNNWEEYVYFRTYDSIYPFGVSGQVFYQVDTTQPTTLHFASGLYAKGEPLEKSVLYYGKSDNQDGKVEVITAANR